MWGFDGGEEDKDGLVKKRGIKIFLWKMYA